MGLAEEIEGHDAMRDATATGGRDRHRRARLVPLAAVAAALLLLLSACGSGDLEGVVLYMPGLTLDRLSGPFDAEDRVRTTFPDEIMDVFDDRGLEARFYSYRVGASAYTARDTGQSLADSARALDNQISRVLAEWHDAYDGEPAIVLVAHSLGGAVAAFWASTADATVLDDVQTVFTFDSPLSGLGETSARFGELLGADAVRDLGQETERMAHGTSRLDFVQFGNLLDLVVPNAISFTDESWRTLTVTCTGSLIDLGHSCSMSDDATLASVEGALDGAPPLWTNASERPSAWAAGAEAAVR